MSTRPNECPYCNQDHASHEPCPELDGPKVRPSDLRARINEMANSSDGDENAVGRAVKLYADAVGDVELVEVVVAALDGFEGWLDDLRAVIKRGL